IKNLRVSVCPFQQLVDTLTVCYKYLKSFVAEEFDIIVDDNIKKYSDLKRVFNFIDSGNKLYDFDLINNPNYSGLRIFYKKITKDNLDSIGRTDSRGDKIIDLNIALDNSETLELFKYYILPHEIGHNRIASDFDSVVFDKERGGVDFNNRQNREFTRRIEEFLVDARLIFRSELSNDQKRMRANQYSKWINLILSADWSPYVDGDDLIKPEKLNSLQILNLMHYFVIMKEISKKLLPNDVNIKIH
ncbi:MAG: hypothetical protein P8Y70_19905, partial [Candidatus Lokiarchaeota archaeon]